MSELLGKDTLRFTEYAAELMVYFERHKLIEISKKILVELALERPELVQEWIGANIKRIASEIYRDCLLDGKNGVVSMLNLSANYLYRIVIFGRKGSGRKTQAVNLMKRFNLVYIDAEHVIYQSLRGDDENPNDPLARELQRSFYYNNCDAKGKALADVISRRILHTDALRRGWVLVNFPNNVKDFKEIMEQWKIPPNKLVYMKCSEKVSLKRLLNSPDTGAPHHNFSYYNHEMRFYNLHEKRIENYIRRRHETVYVNSEPCSEEVKFALLSSIAKMPYLLGERKDIV
uniref:Adenylate kinase n=1 Tax=Glossina brevipalpis TaxID=37001 RepID=A0A1A9WT19_9MUSC